MSLMLKDNLFRRPRSRPVPCHGSLKLWYPETMPDSTDIKAAIKANDLPAIQAWIPRMRWAEDVEQKRQTAAALATAARLGRVEAVQEILKIKHSAPVIQRALVWAAKKGHDAVLALLLPWARAVNNHSQALFEAARNGHVACVRRLIPVSRPKAMDGRALCAAAIQGHLDCLNLLIPVVLPLPRCSALMCASSAGHLECVKALLPFSDFQIDRHGPLWQAARHGHLDVVRLLLPLSSEEDVWLAMNSAARQGQESALMVLLEQHAPPVTPQYCALTPAASKGDVGCVRLLLKHPHTQEQYASAVKEAALLNHEPCVKELWPFIKPLEALHDVLKKRDSSPHGSRELGVECLFRCLGEDDATRLAFAKAVPPGLSPLVDSWMERHALVQGMDEASSPSARRLRL
jgi:ankyrin repeat protein